MASFMDELVSVVLSLVVIVRGLWRSITLYFHFRRLPSWNFQLFLAIAILRSFTDAHSTDLEGLRSVTDCPLMPTIPKGAKWVRKTIKDHIRTEIIWPSKLLGRETPKDLTRHRIIIYLHGGGGAVCSPLTHRVITHAVAVSSEAIVFAPQYRRIPDFHLSDSVSDCVDVYRHLVKDLGICSSQIAIAGDSAGGSLTVLTICQIRDSGLPLPACGALLSPWCDFEDDYSQPHQAHPHIDYIGRDILRYMGNMICGANPTVMSPIKMNLTGFPPLLIQLGVAEILADQIRLFYKLCKAQGVETRYLEYEEMVHIPHLFSIFSRTGEKAVADLANFLRDRIRPVNSLHSSS